MKFHIAAHIEGVGVHTSAIETVSAVDAETVYRHHLPAHWVVLSLIVRTAEEWERHLENGEFRAELQQFESRI